MKKDAIGWKMWPTQEYMGQHRQFLLIGSRMRISITCGMKITFWNIRRCGKATRTAVSASMEFVLWLSRRKEYRCSVPYQYSCRDLTVRLRDEELRIFHGDELIASHRLSYQRGRMITDARHFLGIPKPAYPSGVRAVREVFLVHFPSGNPFLDGLVKAKYGNVRYHMLQILNLLADYPVAVVESAIERAMLYGAFECSAIRNICRQGEFPEAKAMQEEIELTQKPSVVSESVEERALSYYSQLEV
jgi:hypothetical protein